MPIVPFGRLLNKALKGKYIVGYFESWDQYSIEGVLEAAEECMSPVIVGFGGTMMNQEWFTNKGLEELSALGRVVARKSKVDTSYILNEVKELKHIRMGIKYGFNVVMMDTSFLSLDDNVKVTKKIVGMAHKNKVAVEGELGRLPAGNEKEKGGFLTDPEEAEYYVKKTGIDALSVSIGNVHTLLKGSPRIDFDRLKRIQEKTKIPLTIHGGTGFPKEDIRKCLDFGVAKFNIGTVLKKAFLEGIRQSVGKVLGSVGSEVHTLVGSRKKEDILMKGKENMKKEVTNFLKLFNSCGRQ